MPAAASHHCNAAPPSPERPIDPAPAPVVRFWESLPLAALSPAQWEALCDGCGKCCLAKYEDADTGAMHYTDVACVLLDHANCRCRDYARRSERVPDCITLTPARLADPRWLPQTCAYRLRAEGRPLPDWHPLVCGDPARVHLQGHSVSGRVRCEREVKDPLLHLVDWVR